MGFWVRLVSRWIAGETVEDAMRVAEEENGRGVSAIINYLGEDLDSEGQVESSVRTYLDILGEIKRRKVSASLSVKPTQMDVDKGIPHCMGHLSKILRVARRQGTFVWLDMEDSGHTDKILRLQSAASKVYSKVGVVVQADLRRSESDVTHLVRKGVTVRLVKGAYKESTKAAFGSRDEVSRNYVRLLRILFERGGRFAVATHDPDILKEALSLDSFYRRRPEFQFLMGIHGDLKTDLAGRGYRVSSYVPFGASWQRYVKRRIMERPDDILLIIYSMFTPRKRAK